MNNQQLTQEDSVDKAADQKEKLNNVLPLSADQKSIQQAFVSFKGLVESEDVDAFNTYLASAYPERKEQLNINLTAEDKAEAKKVMSFLSLSYYNGTAADFNNTGAIWIMGDDTALVRGEHNIIGPSKPVKEEYNYKFKKVNGVWYVDIQTKKQA